MKYNTVIFDMDGVVIDSEVLYDKADTILFRRRGRVYNHEDAALLLAGMHPKAAAAKLKERFGFPDDVESLMQERQTLLEAEYRSNVDYIGGFKDFHARVVVAGLKTCIATSSNDYMLEIAKNKLGLDKIFGSNIFKASDVGNASKPDPALYFYAAKRMDASLAKCIVIEDAPKGVQAAKNAGMYCIGLTTTFARDHLSHADMVVNSYDEIGLEELVKGNHC